MRIGNRRQFAKVELSGKPIGRRESLVGGQDTSGLIKHDGRRHGQHAKRPCHPRLLGRVDSDDAHSVANTLLKRGQGRLLGSPAGGAARS